MSGTDPDVPERILMAAGARQRANCAPRLRQALALLLGFQELDDGGPVQAAAAAGGRDELIGLVVDAGGWGEGVAVVVAVRGGRGFSAGPAGTARGEN